MPALVEDVLARFKQLEHIKDPWLPLMQDMADYVLPTREDMDQNKTDGIKQGENQFDSTPGEAAQIFIDGMYGYMLSQATTWFRLSVADDELNDDHEVRMWIQDTEKRLYSALRRSNFYEAFRTLLEDGAIMGTGVMYCEEDRVNRKPQFTPVHTGEMFIAENKFNKVDTVFRKFKTTIRQLVQRFGENNMPITLMNTYKTNTYAETEVLHACYPRKDRDESFLDASNMAWTSVWIALEGEAGKNGKVLDESGFPEFPYVAWRYKKSGKETYGRSPGMDAISDIVTLNTMGETMLTAAQLAADPPWNVHSSKVDDVQMFPRGINIFDDPQQQISVVNTGSNYPIGKDREEQKREAIRRHYRNDFFLPLSTLSRQITAEEARGRQAEQAAILGPATGRLSSEGLDPAIDIVFAIELTAGRIAPPPQKLMDYYLETGQPIGVEYSGPLVQQQKRHFTLGGIQSGLEDILTLVEIAPEAVQDRVDWDEAIPEILQNNNFPQTLIRSDEDVEKIRLARAQQVQAQQQADQMLQMTEGVKNMAQADKDTGGGITEQLAEAI